ncbi:DUF3048 domain-containing protein [Sediminibacillus albus]|uniref:Lipoprotein YerB n=1 Tax=Sediminibacillus albus TaxID=407036 RepID=A0A1G9BBM7_9BACI|nr:DUF3048 domain-containing protein [Sediminibacillus albus]SDK36869.1 Protein of unknown function [Sediminibacillus albus]
MRKQWLSIAAGLLLVMLMMAACSKDEKSQTEETEENDEQVTEPEEKEEPAEPAYENVYPLTGIGTDEPVDNRIVAVMVNNHPKARPQSGLTKADIVFEILAEGNITRFMALFHSEKPEVVGPVRSAREYYFNLASGYGALYVYHGAANFIEDMLKNGAVDHLNGAYYDNDGHLFERSQSRVAPHNSYLQFDAVKEVAEGQGYEMEADYEPLPFLSEEETADIDGESATEVSFSYTNEPVRYVYDEELDKYLRYNGSSQTVELDSDQAVQLDNVFLIETHHEVIDDAGRREVDLQSGGDAYLLQKGKVQQVQWKNIDGKVLPVKDGEPVGFVPGKTWVNVLPDRTGLDMVTIQ